jgi:hypothetical protein
VPASNGYLPYRNKIESSLNKAKAECVFSAAAAASSNKNSLMGELSSREAPRRKIKNFMELETQAQQMIHLHFFLF